MDGSGKATVRFTQGLGIDEPLAMSASGVADYYEADGLGSITSLTNSAGSVVNTYEYDSFGQLTGSNETVSNTFRYTGREDDGETKLYYYRARYYDPSVGRFLSEDPAAFDANVNFYLYTSNRAVNLVDPFGLVDLNYKESFRKQSLFENLTDSNAGTSTPQVDYSGKCLCVGDGKYKIQLTLTFSSRIVYHFAFERRHEQEHVDYARGFFNRHKKDYEELEMTYPSQIECQNALRKVVYPLPGVTSTLHQLLQDQFKTLGQEENQIDDFMERWIHRVAGN